jgi:hypothetical protein
MSMLQKFKIIEIDMKKEIKQHVDNLRDVVQSFLNTDNSFTNLVKFVSSKYNLVDEEMFKEWIEKEFPNQFNFANVHIKTEIYDGEENE